MAQESFVTKLMNFCAAKKAPCPKFNLVHDGTGTMCPIFKYEVHLTLNETEIRVIGTGTSKKLAKQDCSRLALEKLSKMNLTQPPVLEVMETDEDLPSTSCNNTSMRELLEFCDKKGLPMPEYSLVGETGPAHAKQFTMQCAVSTFKETATAPTKKAAKHSSSNKMLSMLKGIDLNEHINKHVKPMNEESLVKVIKARTKFYAPIIVERMADYDTPFVKCGEENCKNALSILNNGCLGAEEKTNAAMNALNLDYEITETPTTQNSVIYLLSICGMQPEIIVSDYTLPELYERTNEYMRVFLQ